MVDSYKDIPVKGIQFLHSSEEYYKTLKEYLGEAKKFVYIAGWDFDHRIILDRKSEDNTNLADYLNSLTLKNPELRVKISIWNAGAFDLNRHIENSEILNENPNIEISLLDSVSDISSYHDKFVIIDDSIVFVGGIDLSKERWDDSDHNVENNYRINPNGESYPPYFDMQLLLYGKQITECFYQIASERESQNILTNLTNNEKKNLVLDQKNKKVNILRTRNSFEESKPSLYQIKDTYVDLIRKAKDYIYIENQYFSNEEIGNEIEKRLSEEDCPEIIIVLPGSNSGVVEDYVFLTKRDTIIYNLQRQDKYNKLSVFSIYFDEKATLHSKLMIVDGKSFLIGSANLSNRSFFYDSETNVLLEEKQKANYLKEIVLKRLTSFLKCPEKELTSKIEKHSSLSKGIKEINDKTKALKELWIEKKPIIEPYISSQIADPKKSNPLAKMFFLFVNRFYNFIYNTVSLSMILLVLLGVGFISFLNYSDIDILEYRKKLLTISQNYNWFVSYLVLFVLYTLSTLMFIPIGALGVLAIVILGIVKGTLLSTLALFSTAFLYYGIGLMAGRNKNIENIKYEKVKIALKVFRKHPLAAVILTKIIPSGPFILVNYFTGVIGIRLRYFTLGSIIGLSPGLLSFLLFGASLKEFFKDASLENGMVLGLVVIVIGIFFFYLFRKAKRLMKKYEK